MADIKSKEYQTLTTFLSNVLTSKDLAIKIVQKLMIAIAFIMASISLLYRLYGHLILWMLLHAVILFCTLYWFYHKHWRDHMQPQNIKSIEKEVFMDEHISVKFNPKYQKLHFTPSKFTLGMAKLQGYALYGCHQFDFLWITFTMGFEYFFNALKRIYGMYGNYGKYANKHTSRRDFYLAMINSSMGKLNFRNPKHFKKCSNKVFYSLLDEFRNWTFRIS